MPDASSLRLYVDDELGRYGYEEKPWFLPNARLDGFLAALKETGLSDHVTRTRAPAATDEQLMRFHTPAHMKAVSARCAEGSGSLDHAHPLVVRDVTRLLETIRRESKPDAGAPRADVATALAGRFVPAMNLDAYIEYMSSEENLVFDKIAQTLSITPKGIAFIDATSPRLAGPTLARPGIERAARHVAGAVIDAATRIAAGEFSRAFVPIAGFHHAHPNEARMYCLYNDPALAIQTALDSCGGTVGYVDIDIHHGDGVHRGFSENPRVCLIDLHEHPRSLFPFTPQSPDPESSVQTPVLLESNSATSARLFNVSLGVQTTDEAYLQHWERAEAILTDANPDIIVFESGVDGLSDDPMSNQALTIEAIAHVTRRVRAVADRCASGRLLVLGGGGYNPESLSHGWCAVVAALLGD